MCLRNKADRWGGVAQLLHWSIFLLFLGMFLSANVMMDMVADAKNTFFGLGKWELYGLHKSFGMLLMGLVALRILWRFTNIVPWLGENMNLLERIVAHVVHVALYGVMIAMPVSGYIMSVAGGHGVKAFGYTVPEVIAQNPELAKTAHWVHHETFEWFWYILALHVAGALFHYYVKKDNVLQRMLPVRKGV